MKLGRYEIVRELGKGAMGIVYLAKDPLIGRLVALKTIRPAAHADDDETKEFQQRFIREAQAAGILNHPSIVTVHDIGQDEESGMSFIAMEYVEGQNLKEVLSQGRALSFEQIGDIVAQVAEGLDFAHSKGIVHRDVKPANIILLEGNRAKITDFGIAKIASGGANLTTTGQFLGTPNYMAPEQIKGAPVDGRSDIFSLGICLYECLTRRKPFGGDSLTSISYKIVHEPFPPLGDINPQIPEGFEEVISHCLAKDPAKRYQRGREMSNALRAVIRGERPVRHEALLAEETVITRDRERLPTMEMPFPEAATEQEIADTRAKAHAAQSPAATVAVPLPAAPPSAAKAPAPPKPPRPPRPPIADQFRKTFSGVRALPVWKTRVPAAVFLTVAAILVLGLLGAVAAIQTKKPAVPQIDRQAEARAKRERQLRTEGNALLRQGRFDDAYVKFSELNRISPNSPAVIRVLQQLDAVRMRQQSQSQQLALAQQRFNEAMLLFNEKKFTESIPLFAESFQLNPNSEETASYLKLAQEEEQKANAAKLARDQQLKQQRQKVATTTTATATTASVDTRGASAGDGGPAVSSDPARLTTIFTSNFNDGYIMVKIGADVVLHQNLWEEKTRMFGRKAKVPRAVNTTREFPAKNADLEVWVVVPSAGIQAHQVMKQNFAPGSAHRLLVTYNQANKTFDYSLN